MFKKIQKILSLMALGMNYTETYTASGWTVTNPVNIS